MPQDVALVHVGRGHGAGVAQDEGGGAHVVGDDAEGLRGLLVVPVVFAGELGDLGKDAGEQVGLIDGLFARQHADGALQAHAGVDVLLRQGDEGAVGLLVVLHEHVVPDFQVRAAVAGGGAVRPAGLFHDHEHFGVRAAGAGDAGGAPPVVGLGQIEQVVVLDAAGAPEVGGLFVPGAVLVALKDGEGQLVLGQAQIFFAGQEFPAPGDHFLFEIIAQGPVAQHFKEGQVAHVADLVDVAGADALLHVREPRAHGVLLAHQIGHQGMHAGGGEQDRRVVLRDDGGGGNQFVALFLEKVQEHGPQLVGGDVFHGILLCK